MPKVLTRIIEGLQDLDDDVRAVAAASLVPVVESLVYLQTQKVNIFAFSSRRACLHLRCSMLGKTLRLFSPFSIFLMTNNPLMHGISIIYYPWEEWTVSIYLSLSCTEYVGNFLEKEATIPSSFHSRFLGIWDFCLFWFWFWLLVF